MVGRERAIDTWSVRRPSATIPTHRKKEENGKTENGRIGKHSSLGKWKTIGPALKTRESHTIEYMVSKIVPQILRGD